MNLVWARQFGLSLLTYYYHVNYTCIKRNAYAKTNNVEPGQTEAGYSSVFNRGQVVSKYGITRLIHRSRKRGEGRGDSPPNNLRRGGGATYPLALPIIYPHFPSISM